MDITAGEVTFARGYIHIVKLVFRRDKQRPPDGWADVGVYYSLISME